MSVLLFYIFLNKQLDLNDFFPDFDVRLTQTQKFRSSSVSYTKFMTKCPRSVRGKDEMDDEV